MRLLDAYQLMQDGAEALARVELNGMCLDVEYCKEKMAWLDGKVLQAERRLKQTDLYKAWEKRYGSKLAYRSAAQLRSVLYADMHVKPFKQTEGGEDGTDEESLRHTGVDGVAYLLAMRKYQKQKDFLKQYVRHQINGKLYPSFGLHTVSTYRSSCSDPNLQNVPKRDKEAQDLVRRAFRPSPGNQLLEVDFSGIEVSIAATYHQDPAMMGYLRDPSSDMHSDMAKELFFLNGINSDLKKLDGFSSILRQASKNGFVFPEFYGDYYESCAFNIACNWLKLPQTRDWQPVDGVVFNGAPMGAHFRKKGIEALSDFIEHVEKVERWFWNKRFPVYKKWRENHFKSYQTTGTFKMKTGFRCAGVFSRNQVVNYPVQGSAFHCLLWTLICIVNRIKGMKSKVIGEIHDSVLIDAYPPEVSSLVDMITNIATKELVEYWKWIIVPMRVEAAISEIDGSWAEMRSI